MGYTVVSKATAERHAGSTPVFHTKKQERWPSGLRRTSATREVAKKPPEGSNPSLSATGAIWIPDTF